MRKGTRLIQESFLRLQHSEGIVCQMASNFLSAFIASGQLTADNEDLLIDRSANLAIRLAMKIDRAVESDDENGNK